MTDSTLLPVRVRASTDASPMVRSLELVHVDGLPLPAFTAGAHIDLHLDNGLVRSYSLLGDPADNTVYRIGVRREDAGRGGSLHVYRHLHSGTVLHISPPRNAFALDEQASNTLLLGGGIGITPLLAMAHRLTALGRPWTLVYCGRERGQLAFVEQAATLARKAGAGFQLHIDEETGNVLSINALLASQPAGTHAYCCGPAPMLDAFRAAGNACPQIQLHWEYFSAGTLTAERPAGSFSVQLARTGREVEIPADRSILDVLLDAGLDLDYGCMEGVCGSCRTEVLSGQPDHRDFVLSDSEKKAGNCMMVCCSRSLTPHLVLDL